METKTCKRCGKTKNMTEFNRNHSSRDGHDHVCAECSRRGKEPGSQAHKFGRRVQYVQLECPACGVKFEKSPGFMRAHPGHRFCSKKCNGIWFRKADQGQTKHCTKCGQEKPLDRFSSLPGRDDRVSAHCNECKTEYSMHIATTDPMRFKSWRRAATRNYLNSHPGRWGTDSVLRHQILRGAAVEIDVPNELVVMKRKLIEIHRLLNQKGTMK